LKNNFRRATVAVATAVGLW